jgi:hypothetical protein
MSGVKRRLVPVAVAALGLLAGCSSSTPLTTQRYYDPGGFFSAQLPSANQLVVMPVQKISTELDLLSGVVALPQTPSPSPSQAFGGNALGQPATQTDTAWYSVAAVKAKGIANVTDLASKLLGETVNPKLEAQQRVIVDGLPGLLVVANHTNDAGDPDYSDASAFFLYQDVGFWVRELFPYGEWDTRSHGFRQVMQSFQPGVPAGVVAVPLVQPGLSIESKLVWPLG